MKERRHARWILVAVALGLAGCFRVGRNFSAEPVATIERGLTTRPEVRERFGEPFRTGIDNGFESWTYVYNRWSAFGGTKSKDLYFVFNRDGTVRAFTFNSNFD